MKWIAGLQIRSELCPFSRTKRTVCPVTWKKRSLSCLSFFFVWLLPRKPIPATVEDEHPAERIILSFGCSFRLFFILSEPVVPPLITVALKHAWVWSLEILKWAKIFSFVMYLRRVSVDRFKLYIQWHSTVLLASPLASVPLFAVALVQKGSRHSFSLNLSPSQHHQRPYLPATPIERSASGVVPRKDKSSYCISIRNTGVGSFPP